MLDMEIFGAKLREHRKNLGLTQEETAKRVGVSAQAVSKWESGECLPDCFNLKALGELYGISLDILLETERCDDIDSVAAKIEQIADEYLWAHQYRDAPNAHRELGSDIWKLWKGIYFIETGNRERQREDYAAGNLRVCSDFGLKIWDDDGVACVIRTDLREKLGSVGDRELSAALGAVEPGRAQADLSARHGEAGDKGDAQRGKRDRARQAERAAAYFY